MNTEALVALIQLYRSSGRNTALYFNNSLIKWLDSLKGEDDNDNI